VPTRSRWSAGIVGSAIVFSLFGLAIAQGSTRWLFSQAYISTTSQDIICMC
jgi:hypothetical protein